MNRWSAPSPARQRGWFIPILLGEKLVGTALALGKSAPQSRWRLVRGQSLFTAAQTNVVNTFADFLAIQIANARFQEEQLRQRLVTHELEIAKNIQRSLLLTQTPAIARFQPRGVLPQRAHEVGGDFYDVLRINDHSALLVIADVMRQGAFRRRCCAAILPATSCAPRRN